MPYNNNSVIETDPVTSRTELTGEWRDLLHRLHSSIIFTKSLNR